MGNISVTNAVATGLTEKFRNAQIFRADKYTRFFNDFNLLIQKNTLFSISSIDNDLGNLFKTVYYQDFCQMRMDVFNSTFQ